MQHLRINHANCLAIGDDDSKVLPKKHSTLDGWVLFPTKGETMLQRIEKILDSSDRAYLLYNIPEEKVFYANDICLKSFGNSKNKVDIHQIFDTEEMTGHLSDSIREKLLSHSTAFASDIMTKTNKNQRNLCDMRLGFINDERSEIFVELNFKTDDRLEITKNYVMASDKATFILENDEKFTLFCGNQNFYNIFSGTQKEFESLYDGKLGNTFTYQTQSDVLAQIHEALENAQHYHLDVEILTPSGETKWYYLDIVRRAMDNSGDKLLCFLVSIEQRVAVANQLRYVQEYFDLMQELSVNLLFRVDINSKTLYRSEEAADRYNMPAVVENFPESVRDGGAVHPEDMDMYINFGHQLLKGLEGSLTARMTVRPGEYEYMCLTYKALRGEDGQVREMIGKAVNVHLKTMEELTAVT